MKVGFLSDTHGNIKWTLKALDFFKDCDRILHLGDVLAHGPRNSITDGYDPKDLSEILKEKSNIFYIRGNCDADVDEMVLDKDVSKSEDFLEWGDLKIYATHGYLESESSRFYRALELGANVIVTGHTHIKVLEKKDEIVILNPGSTTLPKDGTHSVCVCENGVFSLIDISNGNIIKTLDL